MILYSHVYISYKISYNEITDMPIIQEIRQLIYLTSKQIISSYYPPQAKMGEDQLEAWIENLQTTGVEDSW